MHHALPVADVHEIITSIRNYAWQDLLWSLGVVVVAIVVGRLAAFLLLRATSRVAARTDTTIDDAITEHAPRPLRWLLPLVALTLALPLLIASDETIAALRHVTLVASIAAGGWLLLRLVRAAEDVVDARLDLSASDNLQARAVATQTRGFRNIAGFLIVLLTLGAALMTFPPVRQVGGALLASAGVAGLVVGFAAQRSIATVLAGIQIAITQPIRVDDVVIVEGEWGRIEEITLTYVVVKIWDLRRLVVPIIYFIDQPFQNWTRVSADLLATVELPLDYGVPVDEVRSELQRLLESAPEWDRATWNLQVTASGDRTMTLRALFGVHNASDGWNLRCRVREQLITFVRTHHPSALPRLRADLTREPASDEPK